VSASTLTLKVVSPTGVLLEMEASSVQVPGDDGSFGVLPRHAAMTALTASGMLRAKGADGQATEWVIHDGFAQVRNNVISILTRSAEQPEEIDVARAERAVERARGRLRAHKAEIDLVRAQMALRRALIRERLARKQ
jgi:F-type H+-transporting ATPase subunit epsilon